LNRDRALELQKRALWDWVGALGGSSPGAHLFESKGVRGAIVPACPLRSVPNSIAYDGTADLAAALDGLEVAYTDAGVIARTVWVPEFEDETIALLEGSGYAIDGTPAAMSLELDSFEPLDPGDLDWSADASAADLGRLNDLGYGLADADGMATALTERHPDVTLYSARVDGEVVCVLGTMDHDADLGFYFVATHPDHRGIGLASRRMSVALSDARDRGLATSTLQSSAMGNPVYLRLGFEEHFRLNLYERRVSA
jgi:GNAT superfamily N-acetyltransferase